MTRSRNWDIFAFDARGTSTCGRLLVRLRDQIKLSKYLTEPLLQFIPMLVYRYLKFITRMKDDKVKSIK